MDKNRHWRADADLYRGASLADKPERRAQVIPGFPGLPPEPAAARPGVWVLITIIVLGIIFIPRRYIATPGATQVAEQCEVKPFRKDEAASLIESGAVVAYHRLAGPNCVDEIFAIYPDGRVWGKSGENEVEIMKDPADVVNLLTSITETYGWFGNEIRDSYHVPCRQCFAHYVIVAHDGQQKGATAADGGVNMPPGFGYSLAVIRNMLPNFATAP